MAADTPHGAANSWDGILAPDEKVLWQGRPDPAIAWGAFDLRRTLFGSVIIAFAIIWTLGAVSSAPAGLPKLILSLIGLFFLGQGLRQAGGYLVFEAYRRRHSWYSLTNRRALIATDMLGRKRLRSYPLTQTTAVRLAEADLGDIWFAKDYRKSRQGRRHGQVGFERLREARAVYDLMRRVQRENADDDAGAGGK